MDAIDLSIIIVNWHSKEYLKACISSIMTQKVDLVYEIIVIDAASYDGCKAMLKSFGEKVTFIQSRENLGFSRTNNEAYPYASGNTILFLNPDTLIKDNAIEVLFKALHQLPCAGIVGAKLLNTDHSVQTSCVQSFPTIFNIMVDTDFFRSLFPRASIWGMESLYSETFQPVEVDMISGACLMIKREVFDKLGHFPTEYFMYSEDVDLCFQSRVKGYKNYLVPQAQIIHHGGGSSRKSPVNAFAALNILDSQWRYFKKNHSRAYAERFRWFVFFSSQVRIFLLLSAYPFYALSGEKKVVRNALEKWMIRLKWTLTAKVDQVSFRSG